MFVYSNNFSNMVLLLISVPGPVVELAAKQKGGHFMILEWKIPKEANGHITGYDVEYEKSKLAIHILYGFKVYLE